MPGKDEDTISALDARWEPVAAMGQELRVVIPNRFSGTPEGCFVTPGFILGSRFLFDLPLDLSELGHNFATSPCKERFRRHERYTLTGPTYPSSSLRQTRLSFSSKLIKTLRR
jgi:hypothetical protein